MILGVFVDFWDFFRIFGIFGIFSDFLDFFGGCTRIFLSEQPLGSSVSFNLGFSNVRRLTNLRKPPDRVLSYKIPCFDGLD